MAKNAFKCAEIIWTIARSDVKRALRVSLSSDSAVGGWARAVQTSLLKSALLSDLCPTRGRLRAASLFALYRDRLKRWALGCVNSPPPAARGSLEAGFTQPRAHLLADP